jgi:PIN like domain
MVANAPKSKKRSVASLPSLPEQFVFFTDENLGRHVVPEALRVAGEEVIAFHERFASGTKDQVWLTEIGRNGWILLTKDSRIRFRRNEMEALISSKTRSFVLVSSNLPGSEIGEIFVKALSGVKRLCQRQPAPFIAHIHKDGTVVLMRTR